MEHGLSTQKAIEHLQKFGRNELHTTESLTPLRIFLSQFPTLINGILAIAAVISFSLHEIPDGLFIVFVVILNAVFGFIQEYKAEQSLQKLKSLVTHFSRVLRDNKEVQISSAELVPGDVVVLSEGERIPADGKLLVVHRIALDESVLTGEALPVIKNIHDAVFAGTLVTTGNGHLLVEKTGMQTRFGSIARTLSTIDSEKTPLQKRLDGLAKALTLFIVLICASLIPIGLFQGRTLFPVILLAVSIGIAAVPEGLPAVITIALAIGTTRIAKKNAIVRKMPAIETLGAIQVILMDKTGTLTQNNMKVKKHWVRTPSDIEPMMISFLLGNTATRLQQATGKFDIIGDKTDGALLSWASDTQPSIESSIKNGTIIDEFSFDPTTKTVSTIWKDRNKTSLFVRGAPESILDKSTLSTTEKDTIRAQYETYAKEGLRVIACAKRRLSQSHYALPREKLEQNLEFIGFVGIYDPPRPETHDAVQKAKKAGIKPIMVTGDNELTALTIAKEIGLIEQNEDVVTGEELQKMNDEELDTLLKKVRIYARTQPEDKLRLVTAFQRNGFVVGVTGDGVNDALALKRADVGIAMGENGTDVAKEASDIVLLDDNFATIVNAIDEGRGIYGNILKSIMYLLSGNLSEILLVVLAFLYGLPSPLIPTQILWINLVTDGLPALALASDTKSSSVLRHLPRNPQSPILTKKRLLFISVVGFSVAIVLLTIFSVLLSTHSLSFARTITFNALVSLHLFIAFMIRRDSFFQINKLLLIGALVTLLVQLGITTIPALQRIFGLSF